MYSHGVERNTTVQRIIGSMFEAEYLIFCAGKSADDNGNISLHGIFDVIYAEKFPVQHRPFIVAFNLRAIKAVIKKQMTMKIVVELDGRELNRVDIDGTFMVEKGANMVPSLDVSRFVFPAPGTYNITLYVDDKLLLSRPLRLRDASELTEK